MTPPLHPAIVHFPMALSMLMPLFAAGFALAVWRGWIAPKGWAALVLLQALLLAFAVVATRTGEAEEDRAERVVPESALHEHEERAEQLVWGAGVTLVLAAGALIGRSRAIRSALLAATVVATIVVSVLGYRVGKAGGELVYVHGAASAYVSGASATDGEATTPRTERGERDDH